jgi:hypothetical protein
MPVAYPGVKPEGFSSQLQIDSLNEFGGFLAAYVACAIIDHRVVDDGDEVAAEGHLIVGKLDIEAGRFERGASCVELCHIISKQIEICNVASRRHSIGNGADQANGALPGKPVHIGSVSHLERCPSLQLFKGIIGHPVPYQQGEFHDLSTM